MAHGIEILRDKCQGYGKCTHWAPDTFSLDREGKIVMGEPAATPDVMLLRAAKSCPYRVITVTDEEGVQLFPPARKG